MNRANKKYITLREAAKISGYAPDYVGQLIRSGKIPGKQVYCNVAWLTTEEAVRKHAEIQRDEHRTTQKNLLYAWRVWKQTAFSETKMSGAVKGVVYLGLALSIATSFVLGYMLVIQIENQRNLQKIKIEDALEANVLKMTL